MGTVGKKSDDGRALAALIAVFALMIQALMPAAAMAGSPAAPGLTSICTGSGVTTVSDQAPPSRPKGFAGLPCQNCLAAAVATIWFHELALLRVTYTLPRVEHAPIRDTLPQRPHAPSPTHRTAPANSLTQHTLAPPSHPPTHH